MIKRPKPTTTPGASKPPMFMSLKGGLKQLSDALVAQLRPEALRVGRCVLSVHLEQGQYRVLLNDGSVLLADDVVFATPSYVTADLIEPVDPMLAFRLRQIRYVSTATVSLGFKRSDIQRPMQGAGFIVPHGEARRITACYCASSSVAHWQRVLPSRMKPR
jgi:oxygen-dependent protoporphyrinogen oxidase